MFKGMKLVDVNMLTRKHFNEIARILKETNATEEQVNKFCEFFASENPRFDAVKFKEVIG